MGWLRVSLGGLAPSVGQRSCHCAAHVGGQGSEVAARPSHWQHTKRALKGGANGLSTRDVPDYRRPVGCLEAVITGAGTGRGGLPFQRGRPRRPKFGSVGASCSIEVQLDGDEAGDPDNSNR